MKKEKLKKHIFQLRGLTYKPHQIVAEPQGNYIPILKANNITNDSLDVSSLIYIHKDLVKETQIIKKGDILIAASSGSIKVIGKNAYFDLEEDFTFGAFCKVARPKPTVFPEYLKHFFKTAYYKRTIISQVQGANINNLKTRDLDDLIITIPNNFNDQKRIAQVLSKCESLIQKRKESIALLEELLKSTFLEMFGDPVRNEKGWNVVSLSKFGTIDRGVSKHRPRNEPKLLGGKHPLIQTGDVSNSGNYITNYTQTYSDIGLAQSKKWPIGTLCITIAANIAKTGILKFEACFPDSIVGFVVDDKEATNLYVHHLFSFFQRILEKNAPSAAQKNINLGILRNFKVPQPPIDLQFKFDEIVLKVESIKQNYEFHLQELENLYGSISQKAFKGELDLSEIVLKKIETSKTKDSNINNQSEEYINSKTDQVNKSFIKPTLNEIENILKITIKNGFKAKLFSIEDIENILLENNITIDITEVKNYLRNAMAQNKIIQEFSDKKQQVMFKLKK